MAPIQSQSTSNPSSIAQWASVEALNGPQDFIPVNNKVFKDGGVPTRGTFNHAKGIASPRPESTFYVYPLSAGRHRSMRCTGVLGALDEDFVTELLETE